MSRSSRRRDPLRRRDPAAAVEDAVESAERSDRVVSLSRAAVLLGRNRETLSAWMTKGMPVEGRGGTGEAVLVDLKRVVEWLEARAREDERRKFARPEPGADGDRPLTTKEKVDLAKLAGQTMKNGKDAGYLVPRPVVEAAFERCLGIVRISVMAVPERLVREMSGFPEDRKAVWRKKAIRSCAASLEEAAESIATAMSTFEPGVEAADE